MKYLILLSLLFSISLLRAGDDRFGNHRAEICRASYTEVTETDVQIASATEIFFFFFFSLTTASMGQMYIRRVVFSGLNPSTVTFYDSGVMTVNTSTKAKIGYIPNNANGGLTGATAIDVDLYFSSAILMNYQCQTPPCPMIVNWDYLTPPRFGGVGK